MKSLKVKMPIDISPIHVVLSHRGKLEVTAFLRIPTVTSNSVFRVTYVLKALSYTSPYKVTPNLDRQMLRESRQFKWAMNQMHSMLKTQKINREILQQRIDNPHVY
jgi:hypothetical protein